jgi:hypothetical protein
MSSSNTVAGHLVIFFLCVGLLMPACREETAPSPSAVIDPSGDEPLKTESSGPAAPAPSVGVGGYAFHVDGKVLLTKYHHIESSEGEPRQGDVAKVLYWKVILREPGDYRLETTDERDGRLLAVHPDGTKTLFVFKLASVFVDDWLVEKQSTFGSIELAQLRDAWAVEIDSWGPEAEAVLRTIDPERTCVTLTDRAAQGPGRTLPPLPQKLRCLVIRDVGSGGYRTLAGLNRFPELRYLSINEVSIKRFDVRWLAGNKALRSLEISTEGKIVHSEAFGALDELVSLDLVSGNLSWRGGLREVGFVAKMSSLERLDIRRSKVRDLTPIGKAPSLVEIRADENPVQTLPALVGPALKRLTIVATKLDDARVARFRKANPSVEVWHRWEAALRSATEGSTKMRVRYGGFCGQMFDEELTIALVDDPAAVRAFLDLILLDEDESTTPCACCGTPTFELYRGNELVVSLSFHHGKKLRWMDGWPADAKLTASSQRALVAWLAAKGFRYPDPPPEPPPPDPLSNL